jgi:phospho-N-acetylmuramoyl-pentapeptide-transferase
LCLTGIPLLRKIKVGQPVLKYVEKHKNKNGTPTMGGIFFIFSLVLVFIITKNNGKIALASLTVSLAFFVVGFLDDFLKVKSHDNQGLKAYQKIIFQLIISLFLGVYAYINGLDKLIIPYFNKKIELGWIVVPFSVLVLIASTNAVNLTDGLDGLSASVTVCYLFFFSGLLFLQKTQTLSIINSNEIDSLVCLSTSLLGALLAFLLFNVNKASVFMGDCGSLALGGFLGAISLLTFNALYLLVLGVMFVLSIVSVIVQVLYYKRTKKRVFLMAPYHHHLQMKGLTESKISFIYSVITCIIGLTIIISYL